MADKRQRKERENKYIDYTFLFIIIFLLCFGLVMLYSSSAYSANNTYGDGAHFLKLQIRNILLGTLCMVFFAMVDYRWWKKWGMAIYFLAFALCTAVLFVGKSSHGQARWLSLGPLSFQPSEFAKFAVVLFLAMIIEKVVRSLKDFKSLAKVMVMLVPLVGVIANNNLSTGIIVMAIAMCMLFVASPKYSHFVILVICGAAFLCVFLLMASYRSDRITAWLNPETAKNGYQILMGLYAIGSGGIFGKGLGNSLQKLGNMPESQNDMIFSIVCEELGLFGAICLILLFVILIWRMMIIANNSRDLYGALLVVGVMSHVAIQVVLNIAVVTNSIPNTGVTLPFISDGGTSLIFLMAEMGLLLSVSRGIQLESIE